MTLMEQRIIQLNVETYHINCSAGVVVFFDAIVSTKQLVCERGSFGGEDEHHQSYPTSP
jgi:hypothetical protein